MNDALSRSHEFLQNLIDLKLWEKARWSGTAFMPMHGNALPVVAIAFLDEKAAKDIFVGIHSRVGKIDEDNMIGVCLWEGGIQKNPFAYAVQIKPNVVEVMDHFGVEFATGQVEKYASVFRLNWMNPSTPSIGVQTLKRDLVTSHGKYLLCPALLSGSAFKVFEEFGIEKSILAFKDLTALDEEAQRIRNSSP